jgi:osmotically inducible protein OsmC
MALAAQLSRAQFAPTDIRTDANVAFEKIGEAFAITGIELVTSANVPGIDDATFQKFVADAKQNCPVSKALAAIEIRVKATLEQMAARDPQPESRQLRETTRA